jgi:SulP family sulfate permease
MFMVVIGTFAWNSLKILRRVPLTDAFVIVLVTVGDRGRATSPRGGRRRDRLGAGLCLEQRNAASTPTSTRRPKARRSTRSGPLFFGSADGFTELFDVGATRRPWSSISPTAGWSTSRRCRRSRRWPRNTRARARPAAAAPVARLPPLLTKAGHLMVDSDDDPDYGLAVD